MRNTHYNLDTLTKIKVHPKYKVNGYYWSEEVSTFFGLIRLKIKGVHHNLGGYLGESLSEGSNNQWELGDNKRDIFTKHSVELSFNDGSSTTKYFDSLKEANEYANEIKDMTKHNWLTIQYA